MGTSQLPFDNPTLDDRATLALRSIMIRVEAVTAIVAAAWQAYGVYSALTTVPAETVPWTSRVGLGFTVLIAVYLLAVHHSFHRHARAVVVATSWVQTS